jgi:hypothetical protein
LSQIRIGIRVASSRRMHTIAFHEAVEARSWLPHSSNSSAFATNRFGTTAGALAFVESLYRSGATEVLVDHPRVDSTGAPYGDTLIVRCPEQTRSEVERFCEDEGPRDVPPGDFTMRRRADDLVLWWD